MDRIGTVSAEAGWPGHGVWPVSPGEEWARIAESARRLSATRTAIDAWAAGIGAASELSGLVRDCAAAVEKAVAAAGDLMELVGGPGMPGHAGAGPAGAPVGPSSAALGVGQGGPTWR